MPLFKRGTRIGMRNGSLRMAAHMVFDLAFLLCSCAVTSTSFFSRLRMRHPEAALDIRKCKAQKGLDGIYWLVKIMYY